MISQTPKISPKLRGKPHLLAIDQGTTGTRAFIFDAQGRLKSSSYQEFRQYFPKPGWVEHDADEIWESVCLVVRKALKSAQISSAALGAIGITNQRETTLVWNAHTGRPYHRAIVWQDRRTSALTESLKKRGLEKIIREKTGLVSDPYFSASKLTWLLKHVRGLRADAARGRVRFGTMDSWLVWKLTGGRSHMTDYTNACRTLLFNIRTRDWDRELLKIFKVPASVLPRAVDSGSIFGRTAATGPFAAGIPIASILGDQQASLYGQACYAPGDIKNTFGTGAFLMMNIGKKFKRPSHGLLTTLACDRDGKSVYAFEGAIFIAGALIQWLRDGLEIIQNASQSEKMAAKAAEDDGVIVIPAFAGLGSPYWEPRVRAAILGLTRGTGRAEIIRASLEAIAHQTADVVEAMRKRAGFRVKALRADGGASRNRFLMQLVSDYLRLPVKAASFADSTAWGAAKLAGHTVGLWRNLEKLDKRQKSVRFSPRQNPKIVRAARERWKKAVALLLASVPS